MFRIMSPKLLELFHTQAISHMDLSSKVALFNINYRRPYWVVTLAEASLLSCSVAPVVYTQTMTCRVDTTKGKHAAHMQSVYCLNVS